MLVYKYQYKKEIPMSNLKRFDRLSKSIDSYDSREDYDNTIDEYSNALLRTQSNLQIALEGLRACHWSMVGHRFIAVHPFFDELFELLDNEVDFFAEYLALNNVPPITNFNHVMGNDEIASSDIQEGFTDVSTGVIRANSIVSSLEEQLEETYMYAGTANDHRIQSHIDSTLESLDHYYYFFSKEAAAFTDDSDES